jgi:biotin carboxyl carrier protein
VTDTTSVERRGAQAKVAAIEPALWRQMANADSAADLAQAWLALLCPSIEGATRGLVALTGAKSGNFDAAAYWPEGASRPQTLVEVATAALRERRGLASGDPELHIGDPGGAHVAYPILLGAEVLGVAAVSLRGSRPEDIRAAMRQLQWGAAWFREVSLKSRAGEQARLLDRSRGALDLLGDALGHRSFSAAAMALVTGMAARAQCSRVSLGVRGRKAVKVRAISNSAQFGRKMSLVALIGAAMDEAVDQRCVLLHPAPEDLIAATKANEALARAQEDAQVLTIPLLAADKFVGAVTFERPRDQPFNRDTVELLELAVAVVGPVLEEKRRNDRWLIVKIGESLAEQLGRLIGPGHYVRKLVGAALVAGALFFSIANGVYRVDADAQVEGRIRRAVVAPYDGFIKDALARAGDTVAKGQALASLDDSDLVLERLKAVTERDQRTHEYDKALAAREPAAINIIRTQIAQADAQIKLIDEQISRIKLTAPLAGLVVSGDLSQLIGTAVQRGQVLFEIAPLNSYRVNLDVDEREIGQVAVGQTGELIVSALPNQPLAFKIAKITPIAEARNGRNLFRVEGEIEGDASRLRPGMEGVGKIDVGTRKLAWIWAHPLLNWARLTLWRWSR